CRHLYYSKAGRQGTAPPGAPTANPKPPGAGASAGRRRAQARAQEKAAAARSDTPGGVKAVQYRPLGNSGLMVSAISFGTWAIGGQWGPVDREEAMRGLYRAIDAGVNFFDTADIY